MSQRYLPFKVLVKVLEWIFLKSSGKLFELIEFCASSGKNIGSSGKSLKKFWKAKNYGKSIKKFWKTKKKILENLEKSSGKLREKFWKTKKKVLENLEVSSGKPKLEFSALVAPQAKIFGIHDDIFRNITSSGKS